MIITMDEMVNTTVQGFAAKYPQFKEFAAGEEWLPYWKLCLQTLQDRDLMGHIIFCNDLLATPPVKTFLLAHEAALQSVTGRTDARLPDFAKKAIGAVFGFVFKVVLEYAGQKSVSVSLNKHFMVKTATYYTQPQKKLVLAY